MCLVAMCLAPRRLVGWWVARTPTAGDGTHDTLLIDTDGDGSYDAARKDSTGDGMFDSMVHMDKKLMAAELAKTKAAMEAQLQMLKYRYEKVIAEKIKVRPRRVVVLTHENCAQPTHTVTHTQRARARARTR